MKNLFLALATILLTSFSYRSSSSAIPLELNLSTEVEAAGGAYLVFAGKFGGKLTKKAIAATNTLSVEGCAKGSVIYKFDLKVTKNGRTQTFHGDSDELSTDMHKALKALEPGDEFVFKKVKARLPKDGTVDVWGKKFTVV